MAHRKGEPTGRKRGSVNKARGLSPPSTSAKATKAGARAWRPPARATPRLPYPPGRASSDIVTLATTEAWTKLTAELTKNESGPVRLTPPAFDRTAYQREYMRKRRAAAIQ
jgi:hypothetical protein